MTNQQIEKLAAQIVKARNTDDALRLLGLICAAERASTIEDVLIELSHDPAHSDAADLIRTEF